MWLRRLVFPRDAAETARLPPARTHCESLLLGVGQLGKSLMAGPLERLIGRVDAEVVILGAPTGWDLSEARRILVPSGGARF